MMNDSTDNNNEIIDNQRGNLNNSNNNSNNSHVQQLTGEQSPARVVVSPFSASVLSSPSRSPVGNHTIPDPSSSTCSIICTDGGDDDTYFEPSLQTLLETPSLKWIFVGGKGGVGKTTISCAIAIQLAKRRSNVLILSTDPAHNLSDSFGQKFSNTATLVEGFSNLFAMEIDTRYEECQEFQLSQSSGLAKFLPEMLQSFPGIDEALSFAELMQSVQSMSYSVIVFDTAPTGHTIRLLSFPDILENALKKLTHLKQQMAAGLSMISAITNGTASEDNLINKINNLKAVTTSVRETFQDASKTTFVCVCIPEFLSVYETERLIQELIKQGIDCSNIVVNQVVFPVETDDYEDNWNDELTNYINKQRLLNETMRPLCVEAGSAAITLADEHFTAIFKLDRLRNCLNCYKSSYISRRRMQSKYLSQIVDLYSMDFHIVCIPHQQIEVRGIDNLIKVSGLLLDCKDVPIMT